MANKGNELANVIDEDLLAQLAQAAGIDLVALEAQAELTQSGGRTYTNFTSLPEARVLSSGWQGGNPPAFSWCLPGQRDYPEEFDDFSGFNRLGGYALAIQIQPRLEYYDDSEQDDMKKKKTICSAAGYVNPSDGELIQALPGAVPLKSMHSWVTDPSNPEKNLLDRNKPDPLVEALGLVGSRGMSCAECIKCGMSTHAYKGISNGDTIDKLAECQPSGRMFFYVTDVSKVKKIPPATPDAAPEYKVTTKSIRELTGEDGLIIVINLSTALGIRGKYSKVEEERINGLFGLIKGLQIKHRGSYLQSPQMHYLEVDIKPATPKNFLHFSVNDTKMNVKIYKEAHKAWEAVNPDKEVKVLSKADFAGLKGNASVSLAPEDSRVQMKSAEVLDAPSDDIPF